VLDGRFHHVAGTWDGATVAFYVDGVLQGSMPLTTPQNNTRDLNIGFVWGGGTPQRFFSGIIDEVTIYNRALGAGEIRTISGAGPAGKCAATIAPAVSLSLTSLAFAAQLVGSPMSPLQHVTLTNTGNAALNVSSIAASTD